MKFAALKLRKMLIWLSLLAVLAVSNGLYAKVTLSEPLATQFFGTPVDLAKGLPKLTIDTSSIVDKALADFEYYMELLQYEEAYLALEEARKATETAGITVAYLLDPNLYDVSAVNPPTTFTLSEKDAALLKRDEAMKQKLKDFTEELKDLKSQVSQADTDLRAVYSNDDANKDTLLDSLNTLTKKSLREDKIVVTKPLFFDDFLRDGLFDIRAGLISLTQRAEDIENNDLADVDDYYQDQQYDDAQSVLVEARETRKTIIYTLGYLLNPAHYQYSVEEATIPAAFVLNAKDRKSLERNPSYRKLLDELVSALGRVKAAIKQRSLKVQDALDAEAKDNEAALDVLSQAVALDRTKKQAPEKRAQSDDFSAELKALIEADKGGDKVDDIVKLLEVTPIEELHNKEKLPDTYLTTLLGMDDKKFSITRVLIGKKFKFDGVDGVEDIAKSPYSQVNLLVSQFNQETKNKALAKIAKGNIFSVENKRELHASMADVAKKAEFLIQAGAKYDSKILRAVVEQSGNPYLLRVLVAAGARYTANDDKVSLLGRAVEAGAIEIVRELLDNAARYAGLFKLSLCDASHSNTDPQREGFITVGLCEDGGIKYVKKNVSSPMSVVGCWTSVADYLYKKAGVKAIQEKRTTEEDDRDNDAPYFDYTKCFEEFRDKCTRTSVKK